MIDRGGWPARAAAVRPLQPRLLPRAERRSRRRRALLRQALPEQEELRDLAPNDDDLIALRDEIPTLERSV